MKYLIFTIIFILLLLTECRFETRFTPDGSYSISGYKYDIWEHIGD